MTQRLFGAFEGIDLQYVHASGVVNPRFPEHIPNLNFVHFRIAMPRLSILGLTKAVSCHYD